MAAQAMTGAQLLIDTLAAHGVRYLFGIPGVHTLLPYDLLHNHPQITPVVTRHEAGAGFAADGYARATGEPGVCLVVPGPGTTNLATAALVAKSDSVPLVLITAAVPAALEGRYAIHELDLAAFMRPLVNEQIIVDTPEQIVGAITNAMLTARAKIPGPVQVLIPYDIFGLTTPAVDVRAASDQHRNTWKRPPIYDAPPDETALNDALALLRSARNPIIYAGHGAVRAKTDAFMALVESLNAPVITSNKARGIIPENHPLALGIPSMAGVAAITREADVCLALGTHFNEYTTMTWKLPLPTNLIRVDLDDAAMDINYPAAVRVQGDIGLVAEWLLERVTERREASPLVAATADLKQRRAASLTTFMDAHRDAQPPFHPRFVARTINEIVRYPPPIFTSDGSATESWLYEPGFEVGSPHMLFVPEVQQTMGYAIGAALGAALDREYLMDKKTVVAVVGDGSLAMTLGELATIAAMNVPVTVVVFNDGQYNALRVRQEALFAKRYVGTDIGTLDYAQVARGLGMRGERITDADHLRATLHEAATGGAPMLLDVPITPEPLSERYTAVVEAGS